MAGHEYQDQIKAYRQRMEEQLRAPDGWLTLAGLHWLVEGENVIGANPGSHVPLPAGKAPGQLGVLHRVGETVTLELANGVAASTEGELIQGEVDLESDINRSQTIIQVGDISFFVIIRGEQVGVRVKDVNHPVRINFPGQVWWSMDERFRVHAQVRKNDPPKMVEIPDVLGHINKTPMEYTLKFDLSGQAHSLDGEEIPGGKVYIIFHDLSCGNGSYPAGRFLVSEPRQGNTVVLDFNKAYNPPCAFTDFATCPLPPSQNYLMVEIPAGERYQPREEHGH